MKEFERFNITDNSFILQKEKAEKKIQKLKEKIREVEKQRKIHRESCNHIFDDGTTALKESSHWVSDIHKYIDTWTDEEAEDDRGHTQYEKTCKICGVKTEY